MYRYGWAQPLNSTVAADKLLEKSHIIASNEYRWIKNYSDRSVTELEVLKKNIKVYLYDR